MSETKKMANGENVIFYNNDLETLLAQSAEECESLGILHLASYEKYNKLSNIINIPVIILSSGIGFITGIDLSYDRMNIILGIGSVFVGIIKSIDSYFQLGKRSESHRMCALQYTQINKKIQIELSLCREQRQTAKDMLSIIKTDIKNLQDISPVIDQEIIKEYNLKYGKYKNVKKPNFVNGLTVVKVNSNSLEQEMAAASLSHSVRSGGASRAMSVVDQFHGNYNNYLNNDNNDEGVIVNMNNGNNYNNNANNSSFATHLKSPSKQVVSLASAQLVYTTPLMQTTPTRTSSGTNFRLQDPAIPPSRLSTPQLLSSFQNSNSNIVVNNNNNHDNNVNQSSGNNNGNGGDAISFVIDIPDNPFDNAINQNENVIVNVSPDGSLM